MATNTNANTSGFTVPIDVFSRDLNSLRLEIRSQGLAKNIRGFAGEGFAQFKTWVKDMDKVATAVHGDHEKLKMLAIQTLSGVASDFATKWVRAHINGTWGDLKEALKERYADLADSQYAQQALKRMSQKKGEGVQTFADRIIDTAEQAYDIRDLDSPVIQAQLRDIYIDGLTEDNIARKIITRQPNTLQQAVEIATAAQQTDRTFRLRRRGNESEPMDVDAVANAHTKIARIENSLNQLTDLCSTLGAGMAKINQALTNTHAGNHTRSDHHLATQQAHTQQYTRQQQYPPLNRHTQNNDAHRPNRHRWTADNVPICSRCSVPGHIERFCGGQSSGNEGALDTRGRVY